MAVVGVRAGQAPARKARRAMHSRGIGTSGLWNMWTVWNTWTRRAADGDVARDIHGIGVAGA